MRLIVPFLILIGVLAASFAMERRQPPAELTINSTPATDTLDPQRMHWSHDIRLAYSLYEGLCTYEPIGFTIQPGVAESWSVSDDGITWTFHLRRDAKWTNGDPVTSADFVFSWREGLLPENASLYSEFFYYLRGSKAFSDWAIASLKDAQQRAAGKSVEQRIAIGTARRSEAVAKFDQLVGVRAPDPYTLVVETDRPLPYFVDLVAFPTLFPVHPPTIEAATLIDPNTLMARRNPDWTRGGRLVGNGPYRLTYWQFKKEKRLELNEHYWNASLPTIRSVRLLHFEKVDSAAYAAFARGELDLLLDAGDLLFAPELIAEQREGKRPEVHPYSQFGTYYYAFNCRDTLPDGQPNPFADPRVRRAFDMALDKQKLVDEVTRIHQQVATVFVPPGSIADYHGPKGLPYDADAARSLLAEAGYPGGRGLPPITLGYNNGPNHVLLAQAVARMWIDALGVNVSQSSMETKVYGEKQKRGEFMIARLGWIGDYGDPTTFLDLFRADSGNNPSGFADPRYEAILDQAARTVNPRKRLDLLADAERYLVEEAMPIAPIYHYRSLLLYRPDQLDGVSVHPRGLQMFAYMRIKTP